MKTLSRRARAVLASAALPAALLAAGAAQAQYDDAPARPVVSAPAPDPNEPPRRRLDRLEREVDQVRAIVLQARATGHPVEIKDAGPDPALVDIQTRLSDVETSLRQQTGQIELLSHDLAQAKQDAATAQAATAALAERLDKLEKQVAPPPPPPPPAAAADSPPPAAAGAAAPHDDAKTAYAEARRIMLSGDYPGAAVALQAFLDRYGDGPSAPAARYWLGEVKYVQQDYAGAATALIASLRGWPQTAWAPDAVIKLSQALTRLNKTLDACSTLDEFARRYPKATPATRQRAAAARAQAQCAR